MLIFFKIIKNYWFWLIVISLIALIVWLSLKQNKPEPEIRAWERILAENVVSFTLDKEAGKITILKQTDSNLVLEQLTKDSDWQVNQSIPLNILEDADNVKWSADNNRLIIETSGEENPVYRLAGFDLKPKKLPGSFQAVNWLDNENIIYNYQNSNLSQVAVLTDKWQLVLDQIQNISAISVSDKTIFLSSSLEGDAPDQVKSYNLDRRGELANLDFKAFQVWPSPDNAWLAYADFEPYVTLDQALTTYLYNSKNRTSLKVKGQVESIDWQSDNEFILPFQEEINKPLQIFYYLIKDNKAKKIKTYIIKSTKIEDIKQLKFSLKNNKVYFINENRELIESEINKLGF